MTDGQAVSCGHPFGHRPWIIEPLRLFAYRLAGASHHASDELDPPGDQLLSQVQGGLDDVLAPRLIGDLSTHLLDVAEKLCDRVVIMNRGKMVAQGTVEELRNLSHMQGADLEQLFLSLTQPNEAPPLPR